MRKYWVAAVVSWLLAAGLSVCSGQSNPGQGKWDLKISNMSAFTGPESFVQVRENESQGTRIWFSDLGIQTVQVPSFKATYWMNTSNALDLRLQYFAVRSNHLLKYPVVFNGATLEGGQIVSADPLWYSLGIYYAYRWFPFALDKWYFCGRVGIEYVFINFSINNGHAAVTPTSKGTETKEDFFLQELPIPTAALDIHWNVSANWAAQGTLEGNYINHWNSGRTEGGTVYLSQWKLEAHLQIRLSSGHWFKSLHPSGGIFYYGFRQLEESAEDGNLINWASFGLEAGLGYEF